MSFKDFVFFLNLHKHLLQIRLEWQYLGNGSQNLNQMRNVVAHRQYNRTVHMRVKVPHRFYRHWRLKVCNLNSALHQMYGRLIRPLSNVVLMMGKRDMNLVRWDKYHLFIPANAENVDCH